MHLRRACHRRRRYGGSVLESPTSSRSHLSNGGQPLLNCGSGGSASSSHRNFTLTCFQEGWTSSREATSGCKALFWMTPSLPRRDHFADEGRGKAALHLLPSGQVAAIYAICTTSDDQRAGGLWTVLSTTQRTRRWPNDRVRRDDPQWLVGQSLQSHFTSGLACRDPDEDLPMRRRSLSPLKAE